MSRVNLCRCEFGSRRPKRRSGMSLLGGTGVYADSDSDSISRKKNKDTFTENAVNIND